MKDNIAAIQTTGVKKDCHIMYCLKKKMEYKPVILLPVYPFHVDDQVYFITITQVFTMHKIIRDDLKIFLS